MMPWALVLAADIVAGLTVVELKNLRRNEMVGGCLGCAFQSGVWKWKMVFM